MSTMGHSIFVNVDRWPVRAHINESSRSVLRITRGSDDLASRVMDRSNIRCSVIRHKARESTIGAA